MNRLRQQSGFSLIEIMVVVVLIAVIVTTFGSRLGTSNRQLRKEVRYFAGLIRDIRVQARLKNATYRLVVRIPDDDRNPQTYYVESTTKPTLVKYDDESIQQMQIIPEKNNKDEQQKNPSPFQRVEKLSPKTEQLPDGLFFKSVEITGHQREYTSGQIFLYFFPEGRVEEAILHITTKTEPPLEWSVYVHPLTGRTEVFSGYKTSKELEQ